MTGILTADEFDARFDSGEDMEELFDWDEAFHDDIGSGVIDVAVRMYIPRTLLDAASKKAEKEGKSRNEFMVDAIGAAVATS